MELPKIKSVEVFDAFPVEWWGYLHINGSIQVKRFYDKRDLDEARESPFVERVIDPFLAGTRKDALEKIKKLI